LKIEFIAMKFTNLLFALSAGCLLVGCGSDDQLKLPDQPQVVGLAMPYQLPPDTGTLYLQDYILEPETIDSVGSVPGLELKLLPGKEKLFIRVLPDKPSAVAELKIWCSGIPYSVILKKSVKQEVLYVFDQGSVKYDSVQLAGDMNNWQAVQTNLQFLDGKWRTTMYLNPGRYAYQLVRNGKWSRDPANADSASNGMGGYNSVLKVESAATGAPVIYTVDAPDDKINIGAENEVQQWIILWENYRLPESHYSIENGKLSIRIPDAAEKFERSSIRVWAANEKGGSNDLLIPLAKKKAITEPATLKRDDFHSSVLYFMMVDRFHDGDSTNNKPLDDPRVHFRANYQGGDLAGITKKIKEGYFKQLGVNTIWVSPIVQNPYGAYQEFPQPRRWFSGYHGYWPVYETKVDTRFGDEQVFKDLVETAHRNDMNVIMDFVSNHIHKENPVYQKHPEWFSSMYLPDGTVNIRIWDAQRLSTWFDDFMPDIDYTKPAAINYFSDSALFWLKQFNLDGFRHDATKHVSEDFWRVLTRKVKQEVIRKSGRNVYQIGETFGSNELIASYIGSGMMDAQFNFNQYFDARAVFASENESFEKLANAMRESDLYFGSHHLMGNITGNHDMPRFLYYAGGAQRPGEDDKEAGWTRDIRVEDPRGYERLKMLTAFIMTIPGIPIVYYGDEIGMPGANDPDNRRMMRFSGFSAQEESVKNNLTVLAALRRNNMALTYGDTRILLVKPQQFVYSRQYMNQTVLVVMNRSSETVNVPIELPNGLKADNLKATFGQSFKREGAKLSIQLKPLSFEILTN
jgi:cyclomaltodextrinase / maltogenic alpha-amylase / neopullulanase